jgi:hypothetical protein
VTLSGEAKREAPVRTEPQPTCSRTLRVNLPIILAPFEPYDGR